MDNTMTTELPELTQAMTAQCIKAHIVALQKSMGAKAYVSASVTTSHVSAESAWIAVYQDGVSSKVPGKHFQGQDWSEAFAAAYDWVRAQPIIQRDAIVRKLALAIIDITDQHGQCTERLLLARDFASADIRDMHEAACARAAEMCAGSPFSVVMGAA